MSRQDRRIKLEETGRNERTCDGGGSRGDGEAGAGGGGGGQGGGTRRPRRRDYRGNV